ncbi:hypothetical protein ACC699_38985, partial [Rhizobium ruizarguesonis]
AIEMAMADYTTAREQTGWTFFDDGMTASGKFRKKLRFSAAGKSRNQDQPVHDQAPVSVGPSGARQAVVH